MSDPIRSVVRRVVPLPVRERVARLRGRAPAASAPIPTAPVTLTPQQERAARRAARVKRLSAMSLTELGVEFGTDKAGIHHYTDHYDHHLRHLRDQPINLLEIGIGGAKRRRGGSSLKMWRWYFTQAQIVGLDIEDKSHARAERVETYQGDQSDPELLEQIHAEKGPFDVIIDDGSHLNEHVRASFAVLFPLLADDGIYVIEDTQTSYWPSYGGAEDLQAGHTMMAMVKDLVDGLNYEEFLDERREASYTDAHVVGVHCYHNLVFIQKGRNNEGTHRRGSQRRFYAEHPEKLLDSGE